MLNLSPATSHTAPPRSPPIMLRHCRVAVLSAAHPTAHSAYGPSAWPAHAPVCTALRCVGGSLQVRLLRGAQFSNDRPSKNFRTSSPNAACTRSAPLRLRCLCSLALGHEGVHHSAHVFRVSTAATGAMSACAGCARSAGTWGTACALLARVLRATCTRCARHLYARQATCLSAPAACPGLALHEQGLPPHSHHRGGDLSPVLFNEPPLERDARASSGPLRHGRRNDHHRTDN